MDLESLSDLTFPTYPDSELANSDVRAGYAKAGAYVTLALVEAGVDHSRPEHAAAVTDATHGLAECSDPADYLELAQQELAFAMSETTDGRFERQLEQVYQRIADARR